MHAADRKARLRARRLTASAFCALVVRLDKTRESESDEASRKYKGPRVNKGGSDTVDVSPLLTRGPSTKSLRRERRAAAAAAGGVGILKCESRAHHIRGVVDRDTVQVLCREHIDKEPDPGFVHHKIARIGFLFNIKAVLKTR